MSSSKENELAVTSDSKADAGSVKNRLKHLFIDDRSKKNRILLALMICFFFSFTFMFFGPMEMYILNIQSIPFNVYNVLLSSGFLFFLAIFILFFILFVLKGIVYDFILTGIFSLTLCGYIQYLFLNKNLGALDGTRINWEAYATSSLLNLFIWLVIGLIPFFVYYLKKHYWNLLLKIVALIVSGMQITSIVFLFLTNNIAVKGSAYITNSDMFNLSKHKNIVVFVLDYFDNEYINKIYSDDAEFFNKLKGFTYYNNTVGSFSKTFPAMPFLVSGVKTMQDIPSNEYFKEAYRDNKFYKELKELNYSTQLLLQIHNSAGSVDNIKDIADNVEKKEMSTDIFKLSKVLMKLSFYRYSPQSLKSNFWMYTGNMEAAVKNKNDIYAINDVEYYNLLKSNKLNDSKDKNSFIIYHLNGAHPPYTIDENVNEHTKNETTVVQQCKGVLNIIYEYINQMKSLDIFNESTIIITADHGRIKDVDKLESVANPIFFMKPGGRDDKIEMITSNAPIAHEDFHATVIAEAGGDYKKFGTPIQQISENQKRDRFCWMTTRSQNSKSPDGYLRKYRINGDVNSFVNWELVDTIEIKYPFYK